MATGGKKNWADPSVAQIASDLTARHNIDDVLPPWFLQPEPAPARPARAVGSSSTPTGYVDPAVDDARAADLPTAMDDPNFRRAVAPGVGNTRLMPHLERNQATKDALANAGNGVDPLPSPSNGFVSYNPGAAPAADAAGAGRVPSVRDLTPAQIYEHQRAGNLKGLSPEDQQFVMNTIGQLKVDDRGNLVGGGAGGGGISAQRAASMAGLPGAQQELDAANAARIKHVSEAGDKSQDNYTQMGVDAALAKTKLEMVDDDYQAQLNERQARMEEQSKLQNKLQAEHAQMAANVDPNRLVKDKRMVFGLAAAFGAFGAGLNHTANFALDSINAAVDRDFEAQKGMVAAKKDQMSYAQQVYDNYRAQYGDTLVAKKYARADVMEALSTTIMSRTYANQGDQAQATATDLQDQLQAAAAQARADAAALQAQAIMKASRGAKSQNALDYLADNAKNAGAVDKAFPNGGADMSEPELKPHEEALVTAVTDENKALADARTQYTRLFGADGKSGIARQGSAVGRAWAGTSLPGSSLMNSKANVDAAAIQQNMVANLLAAAKGSQSEADRQALRDQIGSAGTNADDMARRSKMFLEKLERSHAVRNRTLPGRVRAAMESRQRAVGVPEADIRTSLATTVAPPPSRNGQTRSQ